MDLNTSSLFAGLSIFALVAGQGVPQVKQTGWADGTATKRIAESSDANPTYKQGRAFTHKAMRLIELGSYTEAERMANRAMAFYSDLNVLESEAAQRALGESLLRQGRNDESLDVFAHLNQHFSGDGSFGRVGLLLARTGQVAKSSAMWDQKFLIAWLDPALAKQLPEVNNSQALEGAWALGIGMEEYTHANRSSAVYYYEVAAKRFPNNALTQWLLGRGYMAIHKYGLAVRSLKVAVNQSSEHLKEEAARDLTAASREPQPR